MRVQIIILSNLALILCVSQYAGPVDPAKTLFLEQREVLIFVENSYYHMLLIPKDIFGNAATLSQEMLTAEVRKVLSSVTQGGCS